MHYVAPRGHGPGGFVVLPIRREISTAPASRKPSWLSALLARSAK
jgi:hypothetical protein